MTADEWIFEKVSICRKVRTSRSYIGKVKNFKTETSLHDLRRLNTREGECMQDGEDFQEIDWQGEKLQDRNITSQLEMYEHSRR